jgi:hypothetical protein
MGMAPVAHVLFNKFMTFNPKNEYWVNRDRFVLSYVFCTISHIPFRDLRQWLAAECGERAAGYPKQTQTPFSAACLELRLLLFTAPMDTRRVLLAVMALGCISARLHRRV